MNKFAMQFCTALISFIMLSTAAYAADDAELEAVREKVSEMFETIGPEHVYASPVPGWYTVRKGAIVAYISSDGRFLMQGDMIDLDGQVNLSEGERNKARLEMMADVSDDQMILFTPEDVKYTVTVFTDIDCTYCRKLHAQIDDYMANGIEVKYLLYPRSGPTGNSWVKAEHVWCADDRQDALTQAKLDSKFDTHNCDSSMISKHYSIGQDVGLTGTPAIILPDGSLMSGYLPPEQLRQRLDMAQPVAAN